MLDAVATPPFDARATFVPLKGAFTAWISEALAEAAFPASPSYDAAIACVPVMSAFVEHYAERTFPLPECPIPPHAGIVTPLSVNLTAPVGALPDTVAVNTTVAPVSEGLGVPAIDVVVGTNAGGGGAPPVPTWIVKAPAVAESTVTLTPNAVSLNVCPASNVASVKVAVDGVMSSNWVSSL